MQTSKEDALSYLCFCAYRELGEKFTVLGIEVRPSIQNATALEASVTNITKECCQC